MTVGNYYVGEKSTVAWMNIRSSRLATEWNYAPSVTIEIAFNVQDERICSSGLITCPSASQVMVCLSPSAVCDGHFDCPDYWDEDVNQCENNTQDDCGHRIIYINAETTSSIDVKNPQSSALKFDLDCIWLVSIPPHSLLEIQVNNLVTDGSTVTVGTANGNRTVDLSTSFSTFTSKRHLVPPEYSPRPGVSVWIAVHLTSHKWTTASSENVSIILRTFNEVECGPDEFACFNSERCLPLNQQCDGIPQCPSLSDEKGCYGCDVNVFSCDQKCLEDDLVCDGSAECQDFIDEYLCGRCLHQPAIDLTDGQEHMISYSPWLRDRAGDCLFLVTALEGYQISLRFQNVPQVSIISPSLEVVVGEGHEPSDQSTRILVMTYTVPLPIVFREYVTSKSSRMWITNKHVLPANDRVGLISNGLDVKPLTAALIQTNQTGCDSNKYACPSGVCINNSSVCNGYADCKDYGDEIGCNSCTDKEFFCVASSVCMSVTKLCDKVNDCPDGFDEALCAPCGRREVNLSQHNQTTDEPVLLTSPNYPLDYYDNLDCVWQVVAPPETHVFLTINAFGLAPRQDWIVVGWGETFENKTSQIVPRLKGENTALVSVASRNRYMWIEFHTDISETRSGFSLHLESRETVRCEDDQIPCGSPDLICLDGTASEYSQLFLCGLDVCGERTIYLEEDSPYMLTSPNYPHDYLNDLQCAWQILTTSTISFIVIDILDFETEATYDKVTIASSGLDLGEISTSENDAVFTITGSELIISGMTKISRVMSKTPKIDINFVADNSGRKQGFRMRIMLRSTTKEGICERIVGFECENTTVCVTEDAVCDGFVHCGYGSDENQCSSVSCPEFYECSRIGRCVLWDQVCDGTEQCLLGDDETDCDSKRCPAECTCKYEKSDLYVLCQSGWTEETLANMAATTDILELSGGNITTLKPGMFKRFFKLRALYLTNNRIEQMPLMSFDGLNNLQWLNLSQNAFELLEKDTFKELVQLKGIVILDVPIVSIDEAAFDGLTELQTMVLIRGRYAQEDPITIHPKALLSLRKLQTLYVDDYRLCCEFTELESFDPARCFTTEQQSPLFNCGSLMQNTFLRASMWILGLSALIGNFAVVLWRFRISVTQNLGLGTKYVHNFLVLNLAISDFLMGIYMVTLAAADVHFGELYYTVATSWRLGSVCKFAGIVSVLSSEASVFFITLISLDRYFCVVYPHRFVHLERKTARIAVVIIWFVVFILSSLPTILTDADSDIYGLSDVCIGLPLITKPATYTLQEGNIGNPLGSQSFSIPIPNEHKPAWTYSIILFIGVNLICFLTVILCYTAIFFKFRASSQRMKGQMANVTGKEEMNMALRMAVIVGTDLCCWMPVILMGILSQTGAVTIQPQIYAWTVVFILPINSSLNPYLYTVFSIISDRRSSGHSRSKNCLPLVCLKRRNGKSDVSSSTRQTNETHL